MQAEGGIVAQEAAGEEEVGDEQEDGRRGGEDQACDFEVERGWVVGPCQAGGEGGEGG